MHEPSLCDDLLGQVVAIAAQHHSRSVESITTVLYHIKILWNFNDVRLS